MPRAKHSTHPDHVRTVSPQAAAAAAKDEHPKDAPSTVPLPLRASVNPGHADIAELLLRSDGWLRVVPDGDGKVVWWKWKITTGSWSGHYVMVRGSFGENEQAIGILLRKLELVDLGAARPTRDSYYDQG